jgi:nitroreductase
MEFFETLLQRRSVRKYLPDPLDPMLVKQILEAANRAPSAGNLQAYEVVVVTDAARRQQLAETSFRQMFIADAPVVLVFFANPARCRERYGELADRLLALQDATIACAYAELAAAALGLGACWIGGFGEDVVREVCSAPESWIPVALLPIGHRGENPDLQPRRSLEDLCRHM